MYVVHHDWVAAWIKKRMILAFKTSVSITSKNCALNEF